jgi:hypothetical protein
MTVIDKYVLIQRKHLGQAEVLVDAAPHSEHGVLIKCEIRPR